MAFENLRHKLADWITPKQLGDAGSYAAPSAGFINMMRMSNAPRRGTAELIELYNTSPFMRAIVAKIADQIASTEWQLFVRQGKSGKAIDAGRVKSSSDFKKRKDRLKSLKAAGELREIESHPFFDFVENANPAIDGVASMHLTQVHLDIKGEAFWIVERNGLGRPMEYWPVPPHWVREIPGPDRPYFRIAFRGGADVAVPAEDVVWFRIPNPSNPYGRGSGYGDALGDLLDTDEYAEKMVKGFFHNHAKPDVLIGIEAPNGQKINEDTLARVKEKFESENRGYMRSNRAHFYSGKMTVHEFQQNFKDMQLVELREWDKAAIREVFGVPPEVFGHLENSNRATVTQALRIMGQTVTIPRLERLRRVLQDLASEFDDRLIVDYPSPIPDDDDFKLSAFQANPYTVKIGEWRDLQGLPPLGPQEDDQLYTPVQSSPPPPPAEAENEDSESANNDIEGKRLKKKDFEEPITQVLEALRPEPMTQYVDPVWREGVEEWGTLVLNDVGVSSSFNLLNPLVTQHLQQVAGDRIAGGLVLATTKEALRSQLIEGVRAGEGIDKLRKRVEDVFGFADKTRAERIARTEVVRSANWATHRAHVQSGVVQLRRWIATPDDRTRDTHAALHGVTAKLNEPFISGLASAIAPGQFGVPEEDINCRCTTVAVIDDPEEDGFDQAKLKAAWEVFDKRAQSWESKALQAIRSGFRAQRDEVLAMLEKVL